MKIKGIVAFSDLQENDEQGLCWLSDPDSVRQWKFLAVEGLPVIVNSQDLIKFVSLYGKIGSAAISDFSVKDI